MGTSDMVAELKEMSKAIVEGPFPEPKEELKEEPKVEAKEEVVEKEEIKEEPKVEEKVEEIKVEEAAVEVKDEPKEDLSKTVTELKAKIAELEATKQTPKVESKVEPVIEDQDFIKDLDIDEVTRDPKELNKLLNAVHRGAVTITQKAIMDQLPDLVSKAVETVQTLKKVSEDFYKDNPDLNGFKNVVSIVWKELSEKEPGRSMEDAVKTIAPEVRKRLGLTEPKSKPEQKTESKKKDVEHPKLPKKGSSSGKIEASSKVSDSQESQISDMNKVLR